MTPTFFTTLLGYVSDFVSELFDTGDAIIAWVIDTGHEIVLIPVVMMIVVFFVGAIRKLIKGV